MDYLNTYGFFGNTFAQYIYFIITVVGSIILTKVVFKVFKSTIRKVTAKTKTKLDDVIVDAIEEPVVIAIALAGLYFGFAFLTIRENISGVIGNILKVIVFMDVTWLVSRLLVDIIENFVKPMVEKNQPELGDHFIYIVKKFTSIIVWVLGIVFIISNLGYEISTLIAGLGIGGVAIAFAVKDILSNLFGGVTVITDMPFKVGDRIRVDGIDGKVTEIGIRTTKIKSLDGTQYIVPNSKMTSSIIENVSRERARKTKMTIGVEYGTPNKKIEKAKKLIEEIILKNKATDDDALVYFTGFGDSALEILVIYYIKDLDKILPTKDEINMKIKAAFEKEKINMAFPTMTLHLKED